MADPAKFGEDIFGRLRGFARNTNTAAVTINGLGDPSLICRHESHLWFCSDGTHFKISKREKYTEAGIELILYDVGRETNTTIERRKGAKPEEGRNHSSKLMRQDLLSMG
jgi:hypothetical protein